MKIKAFLPLILITILICPIFISKAWLISKIKTETKYNNCIENIKENSSLWNNLIEKNIKYTQELIYELEKNFNLEELYTIFSFYSYYLDHISLKEENIVKKENIAFVWEIMWCQSSSYSKSKINNDNLLKSLNKFYKIFWGVFISYVKKDDNINLTVKNSFFTLNSINISNNDNNNYTINDFEKYLEKTQTDAFLIYKDNKIIYEKYFNWANKDTIFKSYSVWKSIWAVLIGKLVESWKIDINKPVSQYLWNWWSNSDIIKEKEITIRDLITMTSWLNNNLSYEYNPWEKWFYNNSAYHEIYDIIEKVTWKTRWEYANEVLFSKAEMHDTKFSVWWKTYLFTARDLLNFGKYIISEWYFNKSSWYYYNMLNTSQNLNPSYWYFWWLNGKSYYITPDKDELNKWPLIPNAPSDMVAALWLWGQKLYIVPSQDLIIVRLLKKTSQTDMASSRIDNETWWEINKLIKSKNLF